MAQEVKTQARDLVGEARGQVQDQARAGQQKAADGIRALSQELREMADSSQQSGTVSEIARQAAERADRLADWLGRAGARRPRGGGPVRSPAAVPARSCWARPRPAWSSDASPAVPWTPPGRTPVRPRSTSRAHRRTGARRPRRRPTRPGSTCPRVRRCRSTPRRRRRARPFRLTCPRRRGPAAPAGPARPPGRPARPARPAPLGEYVDDLDARRGAGSSADPTSPLDDPYRTGRGDFR